MSEQLPLSSIHPLAPEFLSATALFAAPIDVENSVGRLPELWNLRVDPHWEEFEEGALGEGSPAGRILRFSVDDVVVMLTPVPQPLRVEQGKLPEHVFHVAATFYAPLAAGADAGASSGGPVENLEAKLRRRMVQAHVVMTQVMDALMREQAAVGVYRGELGAVQPPQMITELAESLTRGQAPLPLWVAIRVYSPELSHGRTLGLPLFGHLDLDVMDSSRTGENVFNMLANISDYIVSSDAFLLPGQTIGYRDGEELAITQEVSPADQSPVLRILY